MSSNERRERLLQILKKSDEPVKGSELSAELQVSRQVVVKDIALLRASGIEILATSSGYIILNPVKDEFKIMSVPALIVNNKDVYFGSKKIEEILEIIK